MSNFTQRTFTRNYYESPIVYSFDENGTYQSATMFNISVGGMYFESDYQLSIGTQLYVKLLECASDPYWPEACDLYLAEVRWCCENNGNGGQASFGIGVRFLMDKCRQCGKTVPHSEQFIGMCNCCFEDIASVSDPLVKAGLENYLLGNVM